MFGGKRKKTDGNAKQLGQMFLVIQLFRWDQMRILRIRNISTGHLGPRESGDQTSAIRHILQNRQGSMRACETLGVVLVGWARLVLGNLLLLGGVMAVELAREDRFHIDTDEPN